jgi:hypothetical protein
VDEGPTRRYGSTTVTRRTGRGPPVCGVAVGCRTDSRLKIGSVVAQAGSDRRVGSEDRDGEDEDGQRPNADPSLGPYFVFHGVPPAWRVGGARFTGVSARGQRQPEGRGAGSRRVGRLLPSG